MFGDAFSTVRSINYDNPPPFFWNEVNIDEFLYTIPLYNDSEAILSDDWLTPQEREEKGRAQFRQFQLRARSQPDPSNLPLALTNSASTPASNPDTPITLTEHEQQHGIGVENPIRNNGA